MEYHVKIGAGTTGKGTEADPWEIDTTADLDNIINGTYDSDETDPPVGGLTAGDVIVLADGAYDGIRFNNTGKDQINFRALNRPTADGGFKVTNDWTTADEAPFGRPHASGDGTETFYIDGVGFTVNANTMKHRSGQIDLKRCSITSSAASVFKDKCRLSFRLCLLVLEDGVSSIFHDLDADTVLDYCTVDCQEATAGTAVYVADGCNVTTNDSSWGRSVSSNASYAQNGGTFNGSRSDVFQWGSDFTPDDTTDPLWGDPANGDYTPKNDSKLVGTASASQLVTATGFFRAFQKYFAIAPFSYAAVEATTLPKFKKRAKLGQVLFTEDTSSFHVATTSAGVSDATVAVVKAVDIDAETVQGWVDEAFRGTPNPHLGAYPDQAFSSIENVDLSAFLSVRNGQLYILTVSGELAAAIGYAASEDTGEPDLEIVLPDGNYSASNLDSDRKTANGLPQRQGYQLPNLGAYASEELISGGTF